jgi:hypothetical protein
VAKRSRNATSRAGYRARQLFHALYPAVDTTALTRAYDVLDEPLTRLFLAMERRDQRHALEVMQRLLEAGVTDRDLLTAALLHDCGKGRVPVWLRVLRVISPRLLSLIAGPSTSSGWQGAAYRLLYDAELSALQAEAAGASSTVVSLIRGRVSAGEEPQLALLRAADDAS